MGLFGWSKEKKEQVFQQGLAAYREKNYKAAIDFFASSAWRGHRESQFYMGQITEFGYGIGESRIASFDWYKKAAAQGHAEAQYKCGLYCENGWGRFDQQPEPAKALSWYEKSAGQGYAKAQHALAECYFYGRGTEENFSEAFRGFKSGRENSFSYPMNAAFARRECKHARLAHCPHKKSG